MKKLILCLFICFISILNYSQTSKNEYYSNWKYNSGFYYYYNTNYFWDYNASNNGRYLHPKNKNWFLNQDELKVKRTETYNNDTILISCSDYDTLQRINQRISYKKGKTDNTWIFNYTTDSCFETRTKIKINPKGKEVLKSIAITDSCNKITKTKHYKNSKLKLTEQYLFFKEPYKNKKGYYNRNFDIKIFKTNDTSAFRHWEIEYNNKYSRTRTTLYGKNDKLLKVWDHSCDVVGQELKEKTDTIKTCNATQYNNDGSYSKIEEKFDSKGLVSKNITTYIYAIDSSLKIIKEKYKRNNVLVDRYIFEYDTIGNLIISKKFNSNEVLIEEVLSGPEKTDDITVLKYKNGEVEYKRTITYDHNSNMYELKQFKNNELISKRTQQTIQEKNLKITKYYNKKGKLSSQNIEKIFYY